MNDDVVRMPMRGLKPLRMMSYADGRVELATLGPGSRVWDKPDADLDTDGWRGWTYAYTNLEGMAATHGGTPDDRIQLERNRDGTCSVTTVMSFGTGLVIVPGHAAVLTTDWTEFRASKAAFHAFAKGEGLATRSLRDVLAGNAQVRAYLDGDWVDPRKLTISNLDAFDTPPLVQVARQWGIDMVPLADLEQSADFAVEVSRVPGFVARHLGKRVDYYTAYDLMDGVAAILNERGSDPAVVKWVLGVVQEQARSGYGTYMANERLPQIKDAGLRAQVKEAATEVYRPSRRGMDF